MTDNEAENVLMAHAAAAGESDFEPSPWMVEALQEAAALGRKEAPAGLSADFLAICRDELKRSSLTSMPRKLEFARERGMADVAAVHAWMLATRTAFEAAVVALSDQEDIHA